MSISVVIPTYNRASLLPKAVKSVLEQTLEPLEIIIVDDLSTDNTKEVVESFQNEKIKYVVNARTKGANGARNTGIMMAKGNFIAFQDSDDIWLPTKLEKQMNYINNHPEADMCFCSLKIENFGRIVPKRNVMPEEVHSLLKRGNFISTQTIFIKTEIAKKLLFDEKLMRFQDWDFCLRVSESYQVHHLDEVLAVAEVQNDSIGKKVNQAQALKQFFEKYPELKTANPITKSFHHFVMYHTNKEDGNSMSANMHYAQYFTYQLFDKVFNRRNRL
ncbi:glycosyltransferase family 2 protein [Neobacillus cucumis]|uniref:glycosyltransferase family 2 protein n=1 Tax=Neobacillus cucumis TaxID=1740721 RepID=UPI001965F36A|nr:glycosyltransferase [Neobacillus cucumis]MBM7654753.1 glycosyltransferase involved in cell wall biosynthesis [Neobacillus cucumis]